MCPFSKLWIFSQQEHCKKCIWSDYETEPQRCHISTIYLRASTEASGLDPNKVKYYTKAWPVLDIAKRPIFGMCVEARA